jgi:hypothetical protein
MTPPYLPQSNEVDEKKNLTLIDLMNSMLATTGVAKAWQGGFVDFVSYSK